MDIQKIRHFTASPHALTSSREAIAMVGPWLSPANHKPPYVKKETDALSRSLQRNATALFTPETAHSIVSLLPVDGSDRGGSMGIFNAFLKWSESSPEACVSFFRNLALSLSRMKPITQEDLEWSTRSYLSKFASMLNILLGSTEESEETLPSRSAFMLLRLAEASDEAAEIAAALIHVLVIVNQFPEPVFPGDLAPRKGLRMTVEEKARKGYEAAVSKIMRPQKRKSEQAIALLERHSDNLAALISLLWEEIEQRRRCDVRLEGYDRFAVKYPYGESGRGYFLREGFELPGVGVVWEHPAYGGGCYYALDTLSLAGIEDAYREIEECPFAIFTYVSKLLAYHHIVCAAPKQSSGTEKTDPDAEEERPEGKIVPIRAFTRKLRPGHAPNPEAFQRCLDRLQIELEDGYTFVGDFKAPRGGRKDKSDPHEERDLIRPPKVAVDFPNLISWFQ